MGGQEEAPRTAGGVADAFAKSRAKTPYHGIDNRTGCEVLAGTTLGVSGVFFKQAFVGVAFDVLRESVPLCLVDQIYDKNPEFGRIVDLVSSTSKDESEGPLLLAEG